MWATQATGKQASGLEGERHYWYRAGEEEEGTERRKCKEQSTSVERVTWRGVCHICLSFIPASASRQSGTLN